MTDKFIALKRPVYVTDASYFTEGASFPPVNHGSQQQQWEWLRRLYDVGQLLPEAGGTSNEVTLNWYRRLVSFWRDFLFASPPVIDSENEAVQQFITAHLPQVLEAAAGVTENSLIEGVGLYVLTRPGFVAAVRAQNWYPIVRPYDISQKTADVVAYSYSDNPTSQNPQPNRVRVITYTDGNIKSETFRLSGTSIGGRVGDPEAEVRGPTQAVIPVTSQASQSLYGDSDFPALYPLAEEYNARLSKNKIVADRHSNPHLAVPEGSFEKNEDGTVTFDTEGMAFPVPQDEANPAYITWDGQLAASFKQIEQVKTSILITTAMASALLGEEFRSSQINSGAALRRLAIPTIERLLTMRARHELALKAVFANMAEHIRATGGSAPVFTEDDVQVTWPEPLKEDDLEEVQAEVEKINAGLTTREDAIQRFDRISAREAEEKARNIPVPETPSD